MPENEQNVEETVGTVDLSAVSLENETPVVSNVDTANTINDVDVLNGAENVSVEQ
ncbi:hypothetical protein J6V86_03670 [bacterium]|nr:hypothetical protein [bacterium]